jgi:drug/metabolite transporter (DMT)-like permease
LDAVLLACTSAFLFGAMTVAIRIALVRGADAEAGAVFTIAVALAVTVPFVVAHGDFDLLQAWPFVLAGMLGPGLSQLLFTLAIRDAGPSRTSVLVGTAPLFSVVIALLFLDEPAHAALMLGAILIVLGGLLLIGERTRPEHFKAIGLLFAAGATVVFAVRDNVVRWLAVDTTVDPAVAAAATLLAGGLVALGYLVAVRRRGPGMRALPAFVAPGLLFGLSYVALFEAYYRGKVTVVSPLVATESLWGVLLSALVFRRTELVGRRLIGGAVLVVAGGMLIGAFR